MHLCTTATRWIESVLKHPETGLAGGTNREAILALRADIRLGRVLRTAGRALAATWPALLAWFLAGWTLRLLLLRFAGWAAENVDPLVGQLIVPLAVLARLASYVAMFLIVRPALPSYRRLDAVADRSQEGPAPSFLASWANTVGRAILPFFVIYAAWGLIADDAFDYSSAALDQMNLDKAAGTTPLDTPFTWQTISIVVVAFVLRRVLAHFGPRVPAWVGIVAVYLIGIPFTAWRVDSGLVATVVSAVQYLPGDAIKVVVSALITAAVHRAYPVPEAGRRRGEE